MSEPSPESVEEITAVILEYQLKAAGLRLWSGRSGHTWVCVTCGTRRGPYGSRPDNGLRSAARYAVEHARNAHGVTA